MWVSPGFRLFIEHKLYETAFYSTVLNDWGTSYYCVRELGERAFALVDLGHHAPNVNIEMIVARLIHAGSCSRSTSHRKPVQRTVGGHQKCKENGGSSA